jgi:hypothetical protein
MLRTDLRRLAWTFAGDGEVHLLAGRPAVVTIRGNPLCKGVQAAEPGCDFVCALLERLFTVLVHPSCRVVETACESCAGAGMRILLIHPNYHSGGAEIAGNWPPAWVAYLTGYLKAGGYTDVHFVDAMTHHLDDDQVRAASPSSSPTSSAAPPSRRPSTRPSGAAAGQGGEPRSSPCWAASTAPSCTRRCWSRRPGSTPSCAARASRCS